MTLRIGLWVKAGNCYSGGRIALTMYAIAMARAGAEVWFITDGDLLWRDDFNIPGNMHIVGLDDPRPEDLDLLVTDCRGEVAERCVEFKLAHPDVPLLVVAFETPNWVAHLDARLAMQMRQEDFRTIEKHADMLVAISHEGARHLAEFYRDGKPIEVIYPALNTDAIDRAQPETKGDRPFAVFSARSVSHKHLGLAIKAVMSLPFPFDLYVIGCGAELDAHGDSNHAIKSVHCLSDVEKFALMKAARVVLAPSTFEGFGLVPGEAILCETPVVAFGLPVLSEAYGDDAIYARHASEEDYVRAVARSVMGPKDDMKPAATRVRARFGLDSCPERVQAHPYHAVTRTRLSVNMICYATPAPLVEACLRSVYDVAAEINVAYGPVPFWRDHPEGGTLNALRAFRDPCRKLRIEARSEWADKREMWQWCGRAQTGNYQLVTGADMVWVGLDKWLVEASKPGSPFTWATPRWVNFWHSLDWWIRGPEGPSRWGEKMEPFGSLCRHRLFGWWRHSYRFDVHTEPVDFCGRRLWSVEGNRRASELCPETVCYHLGHVLPAALMAQKHAYYSERDGDGQHGAFWRDWNGESGPCGDGVVARVDWELPQVVRDLAAAASGGR